MVFLESYSLGLSLWFSLKERLRALHPYLKTWAVHGSDDGVRICMYEKRNITYGIRKCNIKTPKVSRNLGRKPKVTQTIKYIAIYFFHIASL